MNTAVMSRPDTDLCNVLPCLPEKFVVDFANGIDVARDHIRVQRSRTGFFARLYDGFTGQGQRRQTEINASLADGVEGALTWLTELTESVANSNFALTRVNERIATIHGTLTTLVHYSADTRSQLSDLSNRLNQRCDQLAEDLRRVDFEQRAERQLEQVMNKWAAGRFATFSPAGRCYAAIEELRWGAFGDFCRRSEDKQVLNGFLDDLANRSMKQLVEDVDLDSSLKRVPISNWTINPTGPGVFPNADEALSYLGNWSEPELHPFVFAISQVPHELPLKLPRVWSAERIAQALVSEVLVEV